MLWCLFNTKIKVDVIVTEKSFLLTSNGTDVTNGEYVHVFDFVFYHLHTRRTKTTSSSTRSKQWSWISLVWILDELEDHISKWMK